MRIIKVKGLTGSLFGLSNELDGKPVTIRSQYKEIYYLTCKADPGLGWALKANVRFAPDRLRHVFEVPVGSGNRLQPFDHIVLMAASSGFQIKDEAAVLTWTLDQVDAALWWMMMVHYAASDNIIRKKHLIQPEFCKGVLQ